MKKLILTLLALAATSVAVFAVSGAKSAGPASCGSDCPACSDRCSK